MGQTSVGSLRGRGSSGHVVFYSARDKRFESTREADGRRQFVEEHALKHAVLLPQAHNLQDHKKKGF
jgi:hypothetical protein